MTCTTYRCKQTAEWTVTVSGHPSGDHEERYCTRHAGPVALWDEAPYGYTVSCSALCTGPQNFDEATMAAKVPPATP